MKKKKNNYLQFHLKILPSHNEQIERLKTNFNSESDILIFKNDIVRIAVTEFLETNQNLDKFKETLEKHNYI